ncbi:hypothetical protein Droror1_Dr00002405 [Drosera rotundifolia]
MIAKWIELLCFLVFSPTSSLLKKKSSTPLIPCFSISSIASTSSKLLPPLISRAIHKPIPAGAPRLPLALSTYPTSELRSHFALKIGLFLMLLTTTIPIELYLAIVAYVCPNFSSIQGRVEGTWMSASSVSGTWRASNSVGSSVAVYCFCSSLLLPDP